MNDIVLARASRVAARKVAGEMVILSADDSSLYVLNEIATAVWEAVDGRSALSTIVDDVVCREYEVDRAIALTDVEELVTALLGHGVLAEVS